MAKIEIDSVSKSFTDSNGEEFTVLDQISFEAESGSFRPSLARLLLLWVRLGVENPHY